MRVLKRILPMKQFNPKIPGNASLFVEMFKAAHYYTVPNRLLVIMAATKGITTSAFGYICTDIYEISTG